MDAGRRIASNENARCASLPRVAATAAAVLAICALGSCVGSPTQQRPRPLDAPVRSAARLFDEFLSPQAVARDLQQMRDRSTQLAADEADFGDARATAGEIADRELRRPRAMVEGAENLLAGEGDRLARFPDAEGFAAIDPQKDFTDLRSSVLDLPRTLGLDRRPLGEPDDRRHRTDPWDNHPEAGWSSRILRRILP